MLVIIIAVIIMYRKDVSHPWLAAIGCEIGFHVTAIMLIASYLTLDRYI